jgi:hypothetical protein
VVEAMKAKAKKKERIIFNPRRELLTDDHRIQRRGLYAHFCFNHNELLIDETDEEFKACLCGVPNPLT